MANERHAGLSTSTGIGDMILFETAFFITQRFAKKTRRYTEAANF
jgi:hypothetical protein